MVTTGDSGRPVDMAWGWVDSIGDMGPGGGSEARRRESCSGILCDATGVGGGVGVGCGVGPVDGDGGGGRGVDCCRWGNVGGCG